MLEQAQLPGLEDEMPASGVSSLAGWHWEKTFCHCTEAPASCQHEAKSCCAQRAALHITLISDARDSSQILWETIHVLMTIGYLSFCKHADSLIRVIHSSRCQGSKLAQFSSVTQSCPTLQQHELQHARLPCPSPTPGACSNSCPLSRWCHPTVILCHPLLLQPSIFPSITVFSNESALRIRWRKYWNFSFNISPSNDHPGLICFRMDWLDLLTVQGTLKSLHQCHSSKASIIWHSAFFIVQLSHPYMTTGKIIALTRPTFVGKVMSPLFNMLSRLVITFLPRSKHLLISWLQSPSAVILEPKK